jgi:hypothetical protein
MQYQQQHHELSITYIITIMINFFIITINNSITTTIIIIMPLVYVLRGDDIEYWMIERVLASKANRNRPSLENLTIGTLEEVPGREMNKICV